MTNLKYEVPQKTLLHVTHTHTGSWHFTLVFWPSPVLFVFLFIFFLVYCLDIHDFLRVGNFRVLLQIQDLFLMTGAIFY